MPKTFKEKTSQTEKTFNEKVSQENFSQNEKTSNTDQENFSQENFSDNEKTSQDNGKLLKRKLLRKTSQDSGKTFDDEHKNFSACVANLAAYNAGKLKYEWLHFPCGESDYDDVLKRIGCINDEGKYVNESFIADYDDYTGMGIAHELGEYLGYEELQDLAQAYEDEPERLPLIAKVFGLKNAMKAWANDDLDSFSFIDFQPDEIGTDKELGEHVIEDGLFEHEIPEELEEFIDKETVGRYFRTETSGDFADDSDDIRHYVYCPYHNY